MTYGEVVDYYLKELGITQSELARKMGTGRQTLNSIIKGNRRGPRLDTAIAIADALGVSLQEMIDMMAVDCTGPTYQRAEDDSNGGTRGRGRIAPNGKA